jgi:hypothetical protein
MKVKSALKILNKLNPNDEIAIRLLIPEDVYNVAKNNKYKVKKSEVRDILELIGRYCDEVPINTRLIEDEVIELKNISENKICGYCNHFERIPDPFVTDIGGDCNQGIPKNVDYYRSCRHYGRRKWMSE